MRKTAARIVFLKVLAGRLRPKENVACPEKGGTAYYKVNGLRAYSGGKARRWPKRGLARCAPPPVWAG